MSADLTHLAERLKALRKAAGLSQQELASRAGVSMSAVFHAEQGRKSDLKLSTLLALAGALGMTPGQLVDALTRPAAGGPAPKQPRGRKPKGS
jgi:transcriptional regulator with XRE-family HTH domain